MGLVRFHSCAWLCRTNDPRPISAEGAHSVRPRPGICIGAAPCGRPQAFPLQGGKVAWAIGDFLIVEKVTRRRGGEIPLKKTMFHVKPPLPCSHNPNII